MTYLELVNKVLTRLREDTVSTVGQNSYSSLIGEFVNDAKEFVENAWDWSALYSKALFQTTPNTSEYTINFLGQDLATVETVYNDTSNNFMTYRDRNWFQEQLNGDATITGTPTYWGNGGVDTYGNIKILLYPIPDGYYNFQVNAFARGTPLSGDTNLIQIPSKPVVHLATALAARERGETGGTSAQELFAIADKSLADAISIDANRAPEKLLYRAV